ncbi:hypothetical protein [Paenibacillus cymbidii]|uniref:hypothetical protein n=1 Tax=Paenibacillus cymbidii TaxID=1639034 RepID=UPI0010819649|nr:hypothetical protein [Paenibacillus cymbidii]
MPVHQSGTGRRPAPSRPTVQRTSSGSGMQGQSSAARMMNMQRTMGNRATQQYLSQMGTAPGTIQRAGSGTPPTPPSQEQQDVVKDRADLGGNIVGSIGESFGKRSDDLKDAFDKNNDPNTAKDSASMGAVSSTADLVGGPFQILSAIRETRSVSSDSGRTGHNKRWNYAATGSSMIESGGKMVSGSAGLVDKAAKSVGHEKGVGASSAVSDYTGTVAEAISAVKNTIMAVKSIYDMYSKYSENGGLDKGEAAKGVIETISNAIQAASSGLKVAKGIMEIMESSTASLTAVIPGVSIAVSGVKIALKTVDVIKAGLNRSAMTKLKREFKDKHAGKSFIKAKTRFRNAGVDMGELGKHKQKLSDDLTIAIQKKDENDSKMQTITVKITKMDNRIARGGLRVERNKQRKTILEQQLADATQKRNEGEQEENRLTAELDEVQQYELAKEMKDINVKRTTRGGLQIGIELTKIAGDIATLTGVGAQVGTPLKIVAAGAGAAMPLVRSLKQAGRDRAAKQGAWKITKAIFNAEKSTEKKQEKRSTHADLMLDMIGKLPVLSNDDAVLKQYKQVHDLVQAAGISLYAFEAFKSDPDKLKEKLVEAMKQRE